LRLRPRAAYCWPLRWEAQALGDTEADGRGACAWEQGELSGRPEVAKACERAGRVAMALRLRELRQDQAALRVLEPIDAYLWKPASPALSRLPGLRAALLAEQEGRLLPFMRRATARDRSPSTPTKAPSSELRDSGTAEGTQRQRAELAFNYTPGKFGVIEERGHWGAEVRFQNNPCGRCQVPLGGSPAQTLVFPCTHAYHRMCLPEEVCILCMASSAYCLPTALKLPAVGNAFHVVSQASTHPQS
ncbi:hypothetical protein CYMTET_27463, partial [Cymbomonas tetramitiformis]